MNTSLKSNYNWFLKNPQILKCSIIIASNTNSEHENITWKKLIRSERESRNTKAPGKIPCENVNFSLIRQFLKRNKK